MSGPNGHADQISNGTHQGLTSATLAQVPVVGKDVGMQKFRSYPPQEESYYAAEHMRNRHAHQDQLNEQLARLDQLIRK